jgi:hypothetical protein
LGVDVCQDLLGLLKPPFGDEPTGRLGDQPVSCQSGEGSIKKDSSTR